MTTTINADLIELKAAKPARPGIDDPLLKELWAIKASLNAAAQYSVEKLAEQANNFDLDSRLTSLQQQIKGNRKESG